MKSPAGPEPDVRAVRGRLLSWYRRHGRHDLPWRGRYDAYRVLVSEYMLQQTAVGTVLPYFDRFMKRFPSLESLASARMESVLRLWSGLGYYARARNLHAAARIIRDRHGGRLPSDRAAARALPGVGPYTAGALLAFAWDKPEALVDGNVARVFSRVFGIAGDPGRASVREALWRTARAMVPARGGRHVNAALMDLGATVCRPGLPDCPACPLAGSCRALRNGWVDRLPFKGRAAARPTVRLSAAAFRRGERVWLERRPLKGLWGGLWSLPLWEGGSAEVPEAFTGARLEKKGTLRHVLTHRDLRVNLWEGRVPGGPRGGRWVSMGGARRLGLSGLTRRLLGALG